MPTEQAVLGRTVAPVQVSGLLAKSPAFVPPTVAVEMFKLAVPVFVSVTVWGLLGRFRVTKPNVKLGEDKFTAGPSPVPVRFTT